MQAGDIFDEHFYLIKQLGSGGFSEVWLAEDKRTNSLKVALKIYASAQANREDVANFIRQFELVYNVHHTNLLPPDSCGEFKGMLYLVLRYCERGSTSSLAGNISEAEAWNFLHDVASGLEYLHQKNIIHQDIKPDNVLITQDNIYLITDFDISAKTRSTMRLDAGAPAGTSAYMSPERFGVTPAPIRASDVWALGASLFELITTDLPFGDLGGLNQKNGAAFPQVKKPVSKDLKNIITLCLQEKPWDRPTAEEIKVWCEQYFQKKKIRLGKKYTDILSQTRTVWKTIVWIGGVVATVVLIGVIIKISVSNPVPENVDNPVPEVVFVDSPAASVVPPVSVDTVIPEANNRHTVLDMARFNHAKEKAKAHYEFAEEMNNPRYYSYALDSCNVALSIKPDDAEMIELKKKIEMELK